MAQKRDGEAAPRTGRAGLRPVHVAVGTALLGFGVVGLLVPEARVAASAAGSLTVVAAFAMLLRDRPAASGDRRDAASPARSSVDILGAAVSAMPEPALLVDRSLSLRFANAAAEEAFGTLDAGDPVALRFRAPDVLAAAEEALASNEAREADYLERAPDDRSFSLDLLPVRLGEAETYLLMRFRDRTAERRIERMRIDFVANASHELRTPLASLMGFIETLQGPARGDRAAQKQFLEIMHRQAGRMARLIDDLLSLSRIETKRRLTAEDRADLAEVLEAVRSEMSALAQEVDVELAVEIGEVGPSEITGDRDELTRVFANLVENACRYAAEGRRVVVGLRPVGDSIEAYVQDFGPGIEERHIPRLTERFYRAKADAFPGGTGLGLSIVRNILLRHGTRLVIRSKEGEGSTFSARFRRKSAARGK